MKVYHLIRKLAIITGICVIAVSVIGFLIALINTYITWTEFRGQSTDAIQNTLSVLWSFITPISFLMNGLGFGGILTLLALKFDPENVPAFKQKEEEIVTEYETAPEHQSKYIK